MVSLVFLGINKNNEISVLYPNYNENVAFYWVTKRQKTKNKQHLNLKAFLGFGFLSESMVAPGVLLPMTQTRDYRLVYLSPRSEVWCESVNKNAVLFE